MKQDIQKIYKTVLLVVFLVLLLFVSCESEPAAPPVTQVEKTLQEKQEEKEKTYDMDGGEAQLEITFSLPWDDGKALSSNHNNTYEYFLLTTEYLSERRDGSTVTGEYTDLKISADVTTLISDGSHRANGSFRSRPKTLTETRFISVAGKGICPPAEQTA